MKKNSSYKLVIEAGKSERQYLRDLWLYRELFFFLAWRDILVRYKQTVIGIAWSVIRPLLTMIVLVIVFNKLAKLDSEGNAPYTLMVFAGLLPWHFFSTSLSDAGNSFIYNARMVSKVYFPRLIIPVSAIIVCLVDFLISFCIMTGLFAYFQYWPTWKILLLPFFMAMSFFLAVGIGLWIASLNVKYRDFQYVVPFIIQFGIYISPVGFSSTIVPEKWRLLYSLNPMVGIIDGFRFALLDNPAPFYWQGFLLSLGMVLFFFISGVRFFRKTEKSFADFI